MNNKYLLVQEALVFSDKTVYVGMGEFVRNEKPILFITGFSGSGKSTLGKVLAKKHKAKYIALDEYIQKRVKGIVQETYEIPDDYDEQAKKIFVNLLKNLHKLKGKYVIEGIDVLSHIDDRVVADTLSNYPAVIMGLSAMKSTYRAVSRDVAYAREHGAGRALASLFFLIRGNEVAGGNMYLNKKLKQYTKLMSNTGMNMSYEEEYNG